MTAIAGLRSAVVTAVGAIAGLSSAEVLEAGTVDDVFALAKRKPFVGIVYEGLEVGEEMPISAYTTSAVRASFSFVVVAEEWTSPAGAKDALDALVEALRTIRAANVGGTIGRTVRLRLVSESIIEPPDRPDEGGPLATVCRYRSTAFTV